MKFVFQLIKFSVVIGLIAGCVVFSMDNQSEYTFWLFGQSYNLPAWRPVLTGFLTGGIFACFFFALQTFRMSMELWRLRRRLRQYEPLDNGVTDELAPETSTPLDSTQP